MISRLRAWAAMSTLTTIPIIFFSPLLRARSRVTGCVVTDVVLRQLHDPTARIVLCRVYVKDAYRQVLVDPVMAPVFGYAMGEYVVVDLLFQFGWRNSPEFYRLMASALKHPTSNLRFKMRPFTHKGRLQSNMCVLPRREGVQLRPFLGIVDPFPVAAATPGDGVSCGTT